MSLFVQDDDAPQIQKPTPLDELIQTEAVEPTETTLIGTLDVQSNLLLSFQQTILEEMLVADSLLVLAKGLGLESIVANMLHVLRTPSEQASRKCSLVIALNAMDEENNDLREQLAELAWDRPDDFHVIKGEAVSIKKRKQIYSQGGVVSISSRIFVVDLLAGVVDCNLVTGIVLLHAENVGELLNESFIINLYRQKNKWGFVKCVTDEPGALVATASQNSPGLVSNPLRIMLRNMRLDRCLLWPRFHVGVMASLNAPRDGGQVVEIGISMTESMERIQIALVSSMRALVMEVRRHNPEITASSDLFEDLASADGVKTDISTDDGLRLLNDLFVSRVLGLFGRHWHRVSWTTKQLIEDMLLVKRLLDSLTSSDCIEFYESVSAVVEEYRKSSIGGRMDYSASPWMMLDEANTVISFARKRVFDVVRNREISAAKETSYLLEEPPKWEQLGFLLHDIFVEREQQKNSGPILIMCGSLRTVVQVCRFLSNLVDNSDSSGELSARKLMIQRFRSYVAWRKGAGKTVQKFKEAIKADQDMRKTHEELLQNSKRDEREEDPPEVTDQLDVSRTFKNLQPTSKRRRTRGGSYVAQAAKLHTADINENEEDLLHQDIEANLLNADNEINEDSEVHELLEQVNPQKILELLDRQNQIIVEKYDKLTDAAILSEARPLHVIMYEPDLAFVRRIEVFQAENRAHDMKTYLLYYKASVEEQRYLSRIKLEKESFSRLIREKGQLGKEFVNTEIEEERFIKSLQLTGRTNKSTRVAGGRVTAERIAQITATTHPFKKVIVDMREFRSLLPNILFRTGFEVVPCVLTVGDYVISPRLVVERKSVPDLISSFEKGNLYFQCERMFRYYEIVVLLIEFDENKSFSLNPFVELRNRLNSKGSLKTLYALEKLHHNIRVKLVMLMLKYPKLRIIWSPSPYKTGEILKDIKATEKDPDVVKAVGLGLEDAAFEPGSDLVGEMQENDNAIDLLKNIPGITSQNYHTVVSHVRSINELALLEEFEIALLIGEENAKKVYRFMHQNMLGA